MILYKADQQAEGHTIVRCKAKKVEDNVEANGEANGFHDASVPETKDAAAATVGDWNAGGDAEAAW